MHMWEKKMLFAYIDPSSMTYLIQIIAGVVIAAGAGIGFYWKRIKRSMQKKKEAKEAAANGSAPAPVDAASEGETFTADMLRAEDDTNEKK